MKLTIPLAPIVAPYAVAAVALVAGSLGVVLGAVLAALGVLWARQLCATDDNTSGNPTLIASDAYR